MSIPFKPQSIEVYQSWIDAILMEASDELTVWESNFVVSIQTWLLSHNLSELQANTLERIYAAKTK